MLRLTGAEPEAAPPALFRDHPDRTHLERFLRLELPPQEIGPIVRHLLTGCPACTGVTRQIWELGERPR